MKAIVYTRYGSPDELRLKEVEKPFPKENEVLIRIHATSVNAYDWRMLRAKPFMVRFYRGALFKPAFPILGADIAGKVEAVGKKVEGFKPGDDVYGDNSLTGAGGFAEYVCAPEKVLARKPSNLTFAQAAAVPMAAITALQGLRDNGKMRPGHNVLINGASGGVGTFAIQVAKALGGHVTAVCSSRNTEQAKALGADTVIDYTKEDFTRNNERYDVILGVNGFHPISEYKRALTPNGNYVMVGGSGAQLFQALLLAPLHSTKSGRQLGALTSIPNQKDLTFMRELIEAGNVHPVIEKSFPLHEVPDAIRYIELGHARGKIVITVKE